jgi:hypothetical protein
MAATTVPDSQSAPLPKQAAMVAHQLRPALATADALTRHTARMQALNLLLIGIQL